MERWHCDQSQKAPVQSVGEDRGFGTVRDRTHKQPVSIYNQICVFILSLGAWMELSAELPLRCIRRRRRRAMAPGASLGLARQIYILDVPG
jgi:hypothetical protein